ncbi:abscisic acid 8'-hydroxylase 3-like [Mercurialis annua]|uniref:abscisic acid 8'-hydroxylase 3-like n=1 Tax=Mercurialis annua TaxID=3986 RepID=UPI0024AF3CBA|nr:abscisic acid 8'-hydroxylase 3-like [Mercurialis annua]
MEREFALSLDCHWGQLEEWTKYHLATIDIQWMDGLAFHNSNSFKNNKKSVGAGRASLSMQLAILVLAEQNRSIYDIMEELDLLVFWKNYDTIVIGLTLLIAINYAIWKAWRSDKKSGGVMGRVGFPVVGETFSFLSATNSSKGCYEFVRLRRLWGIRYSCKRVRILAKTCRHGKYFKTRIFGKIHVFIPSTKGARQVLSNDFVEFNKGYVKSMADAVGENSLLCVPHHTHQRIRRLLSQPFSMPSLSNFVRTFDQMLTPTLNKLEQTGHSFTVLDFTMKMTFDAMCNMLMSVRDEWLLGDIEKDCIAVSDAMLSIPFMIPGTTYYKGIKARKRLTETLKGMIGKRRSGMEKHDDFLQTMIERDSYPSSEKLNDSEIIDNLLTLIIAGQTTTAAAMMWSVMFLHLNQDSLNKLREEQLFIAKNKQDGDSLTLEDLNKMSYGLKVVKETLRMSNVLLWFPRVALNDCTIDGFEIKKGWHVNIDATHIHYDPALYKDPLQFNPSRFDEMQKPYAFIPFGSGPRTCLGMNMAKVTMLVFLHRLTSGHTWKIHDLDLSLEKKTHIPRLRSGCPITLKPLNDSTQ